LAQHEVQSSGHIPVSAEQVWAVIGDFGSAWHPAIATMNTEYDDVGRMIRAFTVHGEDTVYRERLTWFSDSEMSLGYTHIEGIAGVESYDAQMQVSAKKDKQCTVTLSARLNAAEPRATKIAAGTSAIFDDAIAAIKAQTEVVVTDTEEPEQLLSDAFIQTHIIEGTPSLAVSFSKTTDNRNTDDTLCLFIHGIGGNRSYWNTQLSALSPFCNVAALDLRGYGDSEPINHRRLLLRYFTCSRFTGGKTTYLMRAFLRCMDCHIICHAPPRPACGSCVIGGLYRNV